MECSGRRRLHQTAAHLRLGPISSSSSASPPAPPPLYLASVQVFVRYLGHLRAIVSRIGGRERLLHARLASDMMPAATQMHVCANYALRIAFPLAGKPVPSAPNAPAGAYRLPKLSDFSSTDVRDIEARIEAVMSALKSLDPTDFVGAETRQITHIAGPANLRQS